MCIREDLGNDLYLIYKPCWFQIVLGTKNTNTGLGIRSSIFWGNRLFFAKKWANELFAQKNERFAHFAHFWWATWAICSHCSLKKRNERIARFFLNNIQKTNQKNDFSQIFLANRSFAYLSWATWAMCSLPLFLHERPEQFTHSRSFVLSNLRESLTVAHLIWGNEQWANERIPSSGQTSPPQRCIKN